MIVPTPSPAKIRSLLNRLAAGEDKTLFSPDDWAKQLGNDPIAQQFTQQLRQEWLPISSIPGPVCQEMMNFGQSYLSTCYPSWPHLWAHTLRVIGIALALAPEAGIDPVHAFLLGIFHDLGKLDEILGDTEETHEEIGAKLLRSQQLGTFSEQTVT